MDWSNDINRYQLMYRGNSIPYFEFGKKYNFPEAHKKINILCFSFLQKSSGGEHLLLRKHQNQLKMHFLKDTFPVKISFTFNPIRSFGAQKIAK